MFEKYKLPEKSVVGLETLDNIYNDSRADLKAKKLHVVVGGVNISSKKLKSKKFRMFMLMQSEHALWISNSVYLFIPTFSTCSVSERDFSVTGPVL